MKHYYHTTVMVNKDEYIYLFKNNRQFCIIVCIMVCLFFVYFT